MDNARKAIIAIIEDDAAISEMYRVKFEADGFKAVVAADGVQGLKIIETTKPDLILLDLMMPEMNGDEMLKKIRTTSWGKDIPVLVLSNVIEQDAPDLKDLNIAGYIVKAYETPSQIVERIKQLLT
jgi:DNA-binding response OmpR family regulator